MNKDINKIFMEKALSVAKDAAGDKEIPVGAIVVDEEDIIGRGYNNQRSSNDPSAHAEIVALREAGKSKGNFRLDGCDLYSTVKPCKMCREAIKRARIDTVYYSSPKAREATHTAKYRRIKEYSDKTAELIKDFFKKRR